MPHPSESPTLAGVDCSSEVARISTPGADASTSRFRLCYGGDAFALPVGETILGRGEGATVVIHSPGVSRKHARIVIEDDHVTIEDLESRNGTWIGEERIDRVQKIVESDLIRIGPVWLMLQSVEER